MVKLRCVCPKLPKKTLPHSRLKQRSLTLNVMFVYHGSQMLFTGC